MIHPYLPLSEISIETIEDEQELATLMIEIQNISEKNKKISQNNTYKDMLAKINIEEAQNCKIEKVEPYEDLQAESIACHNPQRGRRNFWKR